MSEILEVGRHYRNLNGRYKLLRFDGNKMEVMYTNGQNKWLTTSTQERIWQNILIDEEEAENQAQVNRNVTRPQISFNGLIESDFKENVAGTSWRARSGLGGLLAQQLSKATGEVFQSYSINRQAGLHIVEPSRWDVEHKHRAAKFFFRLHEPHGRYGLVVEKNKGGLDNTWDWVRFMPILQQESMQQKLWSAMKTLNLKWTVDIWDKENANFTEVIVEAGENPEILSWFSSASGEEISWLEFVARLESIETDNWCDLFLQKFIEKDEAIQQGLNLSHPIVSVYRALLPLYDSATL